jgi:hypothetical protein
VERYPHVRHGNKEIKLRANGKSEIEKFERKSFMAKFNLKTGNIGFCRKWKLSFEWSRK